MMRFMWDPKYSVNIKSIDTQHQKFFEIINSIYFLIGNKHQSPSIDKLFKVISNLAEYADIHLKYEEKYFIQFNYDKTNDHIRAHNKFRLKIKEYLLMFKDPNSDFVKLATEIAEFAKDWLSQHILDMDHQYSQFFLIHDLT